MQINYKNINLHVLIT